MTCIVGIVDNDRVWIGGDSLGVSHYNATVRSDEKVFRNGEFIIGFTSSFRMGQILRYCFTPPVIDTWDVWRYMVAQFIPAVQKALKDHGWERKNTKDDGWASGEVAGGTFLVGVRGHLFRIDDDFQVGVPHHGVAACGCGQEFALGAMWASVEPKAADRARVGLGAAAAHSAGVAPPFILMSDRGDELRKAAVGDWFVVSQHEVVDVRP